MLEEAPKALGAAFRRVSWEVFSGVLRRFLRRSLRRRINNENRPEALWLPTCENDWSRGQDLNLRPSGYEPDELPDCSTPQYRVPFGKRVYYAHPPPTSNGNGKTGAIRPVRSPFGHNRPNEAVRLAHSRPVAHPRHRPATRPVTCRPPDTPSRRGRRRRTGRAPGAPASRTRRRPCGGRARRPARKTRRRR